MSHNGTYLFKTGFAINYSIDEYKSMNVAYKMLIHRSNVSSGLFIDTLGSYMGINLSGLATFVTQLVVSPMNSG
jgi:hypothetical protein